MPFKDPVKDKEYHLQYAKDHAEEKRRKTKQWRINNPDKKREWDFNQLGWTLELFETMEKSQGNVCAVCKRPEPRLTGNYALTTSTVILQSLENCYAIWG